MDMKDETQRDVSVEQQLSAIVMKIGWCQGETFEQALERYVLQVGTSAIGMSAMSTRARELAIKVVALMAAYQRGEGEYVHVADEIEILLQSEPS